MVDPAWLARVRHENQKGAGLAGLGLGDAQSIVDAYEKRAAPPPSPVPILADTSKIANVLFAAAAGVAVIGSATLIYYTLRGARKANPGRRAWAY